MAQKRMFDRAIIETDAFLNISLSAKAIYFLLGMECDDEGFVSPTRVLRLYGGEIGDIKNLIDVGLIIRFKSGVLVITDWNQNNYLDKNRIKPTQYQNEKKMLMLTTQGKYELNSRSTLVQPEESSIEERRGEENASQSSAEFSFEGEIKKLEDSPRRDLNIVAFYLDEKKPDIRNQGQFNTALRRHLRAAKQLEPFEDSQIMEGMKKAKKMTEEWVLETIIKYVTK